MNEIKNNSFEIPYVVNFQHVNLLSDIKKCFYFHHPKFTENIDNTRYIELNWKCEYNSVLHGFSGYFESCLSETVLLSINPNSFSDGMFSWFPIFFPLNKCEYVNKDEIIKLCIWRKVSKRKVWYEWCLLSPSKSNIHNEGGKNYWIGV